MKNKMNVQEIIKNNDHVETVLMHQYGNHVQKQFIRMDDMDKVLFDEVHFLRIERASYRSE